MFNKDTDICQLKGVGTKSEYFYRKLGINTVRNLLSHIPFRYQDSSNIISINVFKQLKEGTFLGEIEEVKTTYFRKKITTVKVKDDSDSIRLVFFNQAYLQKTFKKNDVYIFDAKITEKNGRKNIYNPKYEKFKLDKKNQFHVGKIVGVYPETKGLSSAILRRRIFQLRDDISNIFEDPLQGYNLPLLSLPKSIEKIHFPENINDTEEAKKRLAFDEMLKVAINIEKEHLNRKKQKAIQIPLDSILINKFIKSLPYKLTNDQVKAMEEILEDCTQTQPMNRLLNGDVGSGKTVVAASVILNCINRGFSAIVLAPTTVLAKQHFETFKNLFKNFDINIELCISTEKSISDSNNKLIIGTHAILYNQILPKDLNLVIIDEQHRFGVEQRQYFK